jgi:hypothetical protein
VGRERPPIAATVEEFVVAARAHGAQLEIVDVPNGQHSFCCAPGNCQRLRQVSVSGGAS